MSSLWRWKTITIVVKREIVLPQVSDTDYNRWETRKSSSRSRQKSIVIVNELEIDIRMRRKMIVSVSELEIEHSQVLEDDHTVVVSKLEITLPQALNYVGQAQSSSVR